LEQQELHYKDRFSVKTAHGAGGYHKLPTIKTVIKRSTTARKQRAIRNSFIPFSVFEDRHPLLTLEAITAKWRTKLLDPSIKKIKHKGMTLIHEFRGVDLDAIELADATVAFEQDML
jgi:hypothetical protein